VYSALSRSFIATVVSEERIPFGGSREAIFSAFSLTDRYHDDLCHSCHESSSHSGMPELTLNPVSICLSFHQAFHRASAVRLPAKTGTHETRPVSSVSSRNRSFLFFFSFLFLFFCFFVFFCFQGNAERTERTEFIWER